MPLIFQSRIYRDDLKANPDVMYVFGDNSMREGYGGQAKEMRGEPNAVGITTKIKPTMGDDAFFSDADFDKWRSENESDINFLNEHLKDGGVVVWPLDGIGTGLAKLEVKAPKIHNHIGDLMTYFSRNNNGVW